MKLANNALALRRLAEICDQANPPTGQHRLVVRNAQLVLDGVTISVLPEFVTENLARGYIAFTKFRFSKSKIAAKCVGDRPAGYSSTTTVNAY